MPQIKGNIAYGFCARRVWIPCCLVASTISSVSTCGRVSAPISALPYARHSGVSLISAFRRPRFLVGAVPPTVVNAVSLTLDYCLHVRLPCGKVIIAPSNNNKWRLILTSCPPSLNPELWTLIPKPFKPSTLNPKSYTPNPLSPKS